MRRELPTNLALICFASLIAGCEVPSVADPSQEFAARAPSGSSLTASPASGVQMDLAWPDNSANEAGFEVHRSETGAPYALIFSTAPNVSSYSDLGLTQATAYCYKVRPFKISGRKRTYSAFSNVACAITRNPPAAASGTGAVPQNSNVMDIRWTDNSTNEAGFRVEQASSPAGSWTVVTWTGPNARSIQAYVWEEAEVCYRVIAYSFSEGDAPPSNVDCTAAPLSPTNLVAQSPDVHTADLRWTDASLVEDGYEVQRWDEVSNQWGTIGDLPANTESYRDASLASDLTYWYLVRAKKDGGYSYFSNYATVNTATRPPEAPSEVKATSYYHYYAAVAASWKDNSENEQGFRVERAPDHAGPWQTVATVGTNQEYFGEYVYDTDVTAGQQVCYRITAFNGKGEASSSDCATPPAAPTDLVATTVDHQSIDISWSFASNADSFVVFRYGYPYGEFLGNVTVAATEGTYRDAGLNGSTSYWYWLVAVNDDGYSDAPNAFATTDPDPSTAPNLTLAPGSSGSQPGAMSRLLDKGPSRRAEPPSATRVPLCPSGVPPRHECPRMTIPPRAVR